VHSFLNRGVYWGNGWWLIELLLPRIRLPPGLFLGTLAGYQLRLDCFNFRCCFLGTRVMVPLVLPERSVVVQRSLGVERPLSSTLLILVVQVVSAGYDNFVKLDSVRPSTRVRTTRY
jgi:hypothetical protein